MAVVLNIPSLWIDCTEGYHLDSWCVIHGSKVIKCLFCGAPLWAEKWE